MLKTLKKLGMYAIFSLFMILTAKWWLSEFKKPVVEEKVMSTLIELEDKNVEEVKELLGEPKSIHKEKIYTYKDKMATYDILVDDTVKSVVITMKNTTSMNEQQLFGKMMLKEDIIDKEVSEIEGSKKTVIYDVANFAKIEIKNIGKTENIDVVKLKY